MPDITTIVFTDSENIVVKGPLSAVRDKLSTARQKPQDEPFTAFERASDGKQVCIAADKVLYFHE